MTEEHIKGMFSKARGKLEEGVGRLTGNEQAQLRGKARQAQGSAQSRLGDLQDIVRKQSDRP